MRKSINLVVRLFLRGLLFVVPIVLTVYTIIIVFNWLDSLLPLSIRGMGVLIIVIGVIIVGYFASSFLIRPVFLLIEGFIGSLPLVGIIYSSFKDLVGALVGDKKKFTQPILVCLNRENQIYRIGFITQHDLSQLGIEEMIAVYLPDSYNISGKLYVVPVANVRPVNAGGAEIMKFVMSGGVVDLQKPLIAEEEGEV